MQPDYGADPKRQRKFEVDCRTAERIGEYINKHYAESIAKGFKPCFVTFGEIGIALGLKTAKVQSYLYKYSGASDNSIELEVD